MLWDVRVEISYPVSLNLVARGSVDSIGKSPP
jgi:hypothetical protein